MAYTPPTGSASPTWQGTTSYVGVVEPAVVSWREARYVSPAGLRGAFGATFVSKQQFITPVGFTTVFGLPYAERKGAYIPSYDTVSATWVGEAAYSPPADTLNPQWNNPFTSSQTVLGSGFDSAEFGTPTLPQLVGAVGIDSLAMSLARLYRDNEYVPPYATLNGSWFGALAYTAPTAIVNGQWKTLDAPAGLVQTFGAQFEEFGTASITTAQQVKPAPFVSSSFGAADTKLWLSYVRPTGFGPSTWNAANSGTIANSQRFLTLAGFSTHAVPGPGVVNATATQVAAPAGLAPGVFGAPLVNPRSVAAAGFSAFASGTAAVINWNKTIAGIGIAPPAQGTAHSVFLYTRYVTAPGFAAGALGTGATVTNSQQAVRPLGIAPLNFAGPAVQLLLRGITVSGIAAGAVAAPVTYIIVPRFVRPASIDKAAYGVASVESTIRYITPVGVPAAAPGALTTWFRVRPVAPAPIVATYGTPAVKDGLQYVRPTGLASFAAGAPSAFRNEAFTRPTGFVGAVGAPDVQLARRGVQVQVLLSEGYGTAKIFNSVQYVRPSWWDEETAVVGTPVEVFNLNRTVTAFGIVEPRFTGGAEVLNTARVVYPVGHASLEVGDTLAAYRIRTVAPESFTESYLPTQAAVLNVRAYIEPSGIAAGKAGVPTLPDRRQPLDAVGGIVPAGFGGAMVAPRIRTISLATRGISTPFSGPVVDLYTRYIAPAGMTLGAGVPNVQEHFNIIVAGGYDLSLYGTGTVHNVTPELAVSGMALTLVGKPGVKNFKTFARPAGIAAPAFSKPALGPRIRYVYPNGVDTMRVSALAAVADDAPQPPRRQIVDLTTPDDRDQAQYGEGAVSLKDVTVFVTGIIAGGHGKTTLRTNVLAPTGIKPPAPAFGTPSLNKPQIIDVPSIELKKPHAVDKEVYGSEWFGKPFFSPTVVAPATIAPGLFGATRMTNYNRGVQVTGRSMEAFGDTKITLRLQIVDLDSDTDGIRQGTFGTASIPGTRTVKPYWGPYSAIGQLPATYNPTTFGTAKMVRGTDTDAPPPLDPTLPRFVRPLGLIGAIGAASVMNFHRAVRPGTINPGLVPAPDVHPPLTVKCSGWDSLEMSKPITGYRVRRVLVNSSNFDTQWGPAFGGGFFPMKVRIKYRFATVPSIAAGDLGVPIIGLLERRVLAPSIAGDIGAAQITSRASVQAVGFDSLVMGTPKRPVEGQVEPTGDDHAAFGRASMGRGVHAPYIEPGLLGAPRVRSSIRVLGLQGEFGDTVVVGESNCGSKLAVVAQLGDLTKFGQHGVHQ